MASSFTQVANFALNRIGIGAVITDLNENSERARTCARWMDQCRDEVLRDFAWPFAAKAEALARISGQTYPGWQYVYRYPQGAARVLQVADESGIRDTARYASNAVVGDPLYENYLGVQSQRQPWTQALSTDASARVILSDVQNAWGYYTATVTNAGVYPADFVSMLAWRLAAEIGGPLKADPNLITRALQIYEFAKSRSQANAGNERRDDRPAESPSITARA